jgi:hypothetical protein
MLLWRITVSRKNPEPKAESSVTEAAERAGILIRGLQNRLAEHPSDESTEDLEWELQKSFAAEAGAEISGRFPLNQIRERVIEGVAEKILRGWEWRQDGKTAPLENEVIEKLIERVFAGVIGARSDLEDRPAHTLSASKSPARLASPASRPERTAARAGWDI